MAAGRPNNDSGSLIIAQAASNLLLKMGPQNDCRPTVSERFEGKTCRQIVFPLRSIRASSARLKVWLEHRNKRHSEARLSPVEGRPHRSSRRLQAEPPASRARELQRVQFAKSAATSGRQVARPTLAPNGPRMSSKLSANRTTSGPT